MERIDPKIFSTLFFSIFATLTGVGIVVPLLPVYAHNLGASGLYIALIFGGFSLTRSFFLPWFGRWSDRKGRKPFIVTGLFGYFLVAVAFVMATHVQTLITIRIIQGVASAMIMPVVQAYVGDITPMGKEGVSMGMFNMSAFIGLSIGPLLGGAIKDFFSLQVAFGCMGILALAAFFLTLLCLPPRSGEYIVISGYRPIPWRQLLIDRMIISLFFFRLVYATCIGIIWGFLPVFADMRFSLSGSAIGLLVMLGIFVSGLLHIPMGWVADRVNKRRLVFIGGLIVALAILFLSRAKGFWDLFAANLIFGFGGGISMPALMALAVISGNRKESMGSVMSLITIAHSMGMLFGSLCGGLIMDSFQLQNAFSVGAVIMLLGSVGFFMATRKSSAGD
ncbi:MAG: MFS transporter [Desulfobacterales bacterium]|nr:MFS transporter [Desulfobacterales bacterium]